MKKICNIIIFSIWSLYSYAQEEKTINVDEISIISFYQNSSIADEFDNEIIYEYNYGQEPSHLIAKQPSVYSFNDNGTEFGYGYFRIRGLDQTRINVTLDGCPWNEAEDFGAYFANSPDLMASMENIVINRGSTTNNNGVAGSAGAINLESINVFNKHKSYVYLGGGSFNTYKVSGVYNMNPNNKYGLHVKATHQYTDGYRDNSKNLSDAVTIKYGYKFNDKHTIDVLSMNGYHENIQGWIGNTIDELKTNPRANGCTSLEDDNWFMSMNRINYKGYINSDWLITSSMYFQYQTGGYRFDLDNYMRRLIDKNWQTTNVIYDYGLQHNMIGGNVIGKYFYRNGNVTFGVNAYNYKRNHFMGDKGINVSDTDYYNNVGNKNDISTFTIIKYNGIEKLNLIGNIQYRHVNFKYIDNVENYILNAHDLNTIWDFINYGFNADYIVSKDDKIHFSYNHVNREPTRSDMFGGNEFYPGEINVVTPEITDDFEIAYHKTFKKFNFTINGFYMFFNNELILNGELGMNGLPCHENAKDSKRYGLEIDFNWNIYDNVYFGLTGSISNNIVNSETFGKRRHILTPCKTLNADLYWDNNKYKIGINSNYRDEMFIDMNNEHTIPMLYTINLYSDINYKDITFSIRMNNITSRVNYSMGTIGVNNEVLYIKNAPFNFNVAVKYNF